MLRRFFASVREWLEFFGAMGQLALIVALTLYILHLLQPILSPIFTILFFVTLTSVACGSGVRLRAMAVGGLALYASGWAMALFLGPTISILICGGGFLIWFQSALWALFPASAPRLAFPV